MSDTNYVNIEEQQESLVQLNYELGRVAMLEDLTKELARRSGEAYTLRDDSRALFLRELAEEVSLRGVAARQEWTKKYYPNRL